MRSSDIRELRTAADMAGLSQEFGNLLHECEVLRAERDHARASRDYAARLLTGIHSLMYPAPIKLEDGRTMVFRPENPHEFMQALSDRIRALPDELAAAIAKEPKT